MIPVHVKIEPGGGFVEFPHARRYTPLDHLRRLAVVIEPLVRTKPDARSVGKHFTAAVAAAAAAGSVARVFGALGFGAKKPYMLDTAVAAFLALEDQLLGRVFHQFFEQLAADVAIHVSS